MSLMRPACTISFLNYILSMDRVSCENKNIPVYDLFMPRCVSFMVALKRKLLSGIRWIRIHLVPIKPHLRTCRVTFEEEGIKVGCNAEQKTSQISFFPPKLEKKISSSTSRRLKQGVHLSLKAHL